MWIGIALIVVIVAAVVWFGREVYIGWKHDQQVSQMGYDHQRSL